jgi:hypothetical protein
MKTFFAVFLVLVLSIFFELSVFTQFNKQIHIEMCHTANHTHNHFDEHPDHHDYNVVENTLSGNHFGSALDFRYPETGFSFQKFPPFFFQPPEKL